MNLDILQFSILLDFGRFMSILKGVFLERGHTSMYLFCIAKISITRKERIASIWYIFMVPYPPDGSESEVLQALVIGQQRQCTSGVIFQIKFVVVDNSGFQWKECGTDRGVNPTGIERGATRVEHLGG